MPVNVVPGRNYLEYMPDYKMLIQNLQDQHSIAYKDLMSADQLAQQQDQFRILRAVVMPEESIQNPVRYKDEFNTDATAALGLLMNEKCNWQAQPIPTTGNPTRNQQVGPNDMFIATFNDSPFCVMVMYYPNPNFNLWKYNWTMNGNTTLKVGQLGGCIQHNKAIADASATFRPHGIVAFSGMDKQKYRYQWVDSTVGTVLQDGTTAALSTITVTTLVPGAPAANQNLFVLNLYRYLNGQPELIESVQVVAPNPAAGPVVTTFTLGTTTKRSDYYAVTLSGPNLDTAATSAITRAAIAGGFTIVSAGNCSSLGHFCVKGLNAHLTSLSKAGRINALGIRLTDVAMYQYLNGECAVVTSEDGNAWYPLFQSGLDGGTNLYDTVADYPGAIIGQLQEGAYTYHKPVSKKDYDWKEWVTIDPVTEEVRDFWVPLETNTPVKIIAATTQNDNTAGNANGQGAACYVTLAVIMEYKSLDDWTPIMKPRETSVAWRDALEKLELFPDATGNAWHWQDMLHGISKVVKWTAPVWRAAIEAGGSALDNYDPKLGAAARTIGNATVSAVANYSGKRRGRA